MVSQRVSAEECSRARWRESSKEFGVVPCWKPVAALTFGKSFVTWAVPEERIDQGRRFADSYLASGSQVAEIEEQAYSSCLPSGDTCKAHFAWASEHRREPVGSTKDLA